MNFLSGAMSASASGMLTQSRRTTIIAENVANIDTPGFRRKLLSVRSEPDPATGFNRVVADRVFLDKTELAKLHDPGHPLADENGDYLGSNVDFVTELADAREAEATYAANLRMFSQSRQMSADLMELLKK